MESPVTSPVTATWCPSCPVKASGLSTVKTFWSPSVTTTIFAPAARHFLVHASWPAMAPFAPHFESATHPFTVILSPAAETPTIMRHEHESATHASNSFFIRDFSYPIRRPQPHVLISVLGQTGLTISTVFQLHWDDVRASSSWK